MSFLNFSPSFEKCPTQSIRPLEDSNAYLANTVHDEHLSSQIKTGLSVFESKMNCQVIIANKANVNLLELAWSKDYKKEVR